MAADAQVRAQVTGERPDVGAGRADHRHDQVEDGRAVLGDRVPDVVDRERRDGDGAGGDLELLALPCPLVRAHPVDLDGADLRRHLHDGAGQLGDPGVDGVAGDLRGVDRPRDLALGVVGQGRLAEPDRAQVLLLGQREVPEQLGRLLDAEDEHARRHGVEGAGVSDAAGPGDPAHLGDHVVRGEARRLVDDDKAVGRPVLLGHSAASSVSSSSPGFRYGSASPA